MVSGTGWNPHGWNGAGNGPSQPVEDFVPERITAALVEEAEVADAGLAHVLRVEMSPPHVGIRRVQMVDAVLGVDVVVLEGDREDGRRESRIARAVVVIVRQKVIA